MGLKDMLFGKKEAANKVTYREEVKKAVADGKLTADKRARHSVQVPKSGER